MSKQSWIRRLFARPAAPAVRPKARLGVEALADKVVPAVMSALNPATGELTVQVSGTDRQAMVSTQLNYNPTTQAFSFDLFVCRSVANQTVINSYPADKVTAITINGTDGDDTLIVASGITAPATINGLGGNDVLTGGNGNDRLYGGAGKDVLVGGVGDDTLDGGNESDTYRFNADNQCGTDTVVEQPWAPGVDKLDFSDTQRSNLWVAMDATGRQAVNGNLTLVLANPNALEYLTGGGGNDHLEGNLQNNLIVGGAGNDVLYGKDANDRLIGGEGNDRLYGGYGADTLGAGVAVDGDSATLEVDDPGDDILSGDDGNDVLRGGTGNDALFGGEGNDTLGAAVNANLIKVVDHSTFYTRYYTYDWTAVGEDGNDLLRGGAGNDVVCGGNGDDTLYGDGGNDQLGAFLKAREVTLNTDDDGLENSYASKVTDAGEEGNDEMHGGDGDDELRGGDGRDTLYGDAGGDWLYAGWINGSEDGDRDVLDGGAGYDHFMEKQSTDTINDFNAEHISATPK